MEITSPFLVLIILYGMSRLYSNVTGKKPSSKFESAELKGAFSKNSGVWWFMYPITSILFILYDLLLWLIWFLNEIFGYFLLSLQWIYTEVIIAGIFFLLKLLWHYVIVCPWKIIRLAFTLIPVAAKWKSYKIGVWGIFLSLSIILIGRVLNTFVLGEETLTGIVFKNIFQLISIIPLGVAGAIISHNANSTWKLSWRAQGSRFIWWSLMLILPIIILLSLEYIILYLGSLTTFHFTFASLLMGGSLISSFLLLINGCFVIFIVSALPSFSLDYSGNWRTFYSDFGHHIFHNWVSYLLAIPSIVIPTILLSIIPYFVTQGITFMSQVTTNYVYSQRILNEQNQALNSTTSYSNWCNFKTISDDSLAILMDNDFATMDAKVAASGLSREKNHLNTAYGNYSSEYGAAPLGMLYIMYNHYAEFQNSQVHTSKIEPANDLNVSYKSSTSAISKDSLNGVNAIKKAESNVIELQKRYDLICKEISQSESETATNPVSQPRTDTTTLPLSMDICEMQRASISDEINTTKKFIENEKLAQTRRGNVITHLKKIQDKLESKINQEKYARVGGFLLSGLWMCLLAAITYGYGLSILSHLNSTIFKTADNSEWRITADIKNAHNKNPNQPILGIGITAIIITMAYLSGFSSNKLPIDVLDVFNVKMIQSESTTLHNSKEEIDKRNFELQNEVIQETESEVKEVDSAEDILDQITEEINQIENGEINSLKIAKTCECCQNKFDPRSGYSIINGEIQTFEISRTAKYCNTTCAEICGFE